MGLYTLIQGILFMVQAWSYWAIQGIPCCTGPVLWGYTRDSLWYWPGIMGLYKGFFVVLAWSYGAIQGILDGTGLVVWGYTRDS